MDILIWITAGIIILLPYYMNIFLFKLSKVRFHMAFWLLFHMIASIMYWICYREIWSAAVIIFIVYVLYYLFTYIFYVRDIMNSISYGKIKYIFTMKWFLIILNIVIFLITLLLAADILLVIDSSNLRILDKAYFISAIGAAYVEIIILSFRYKHIGREV